MGRFLRLTFVPFFLPLLPTQESVRSKSLSNQSRPELLASQSSWSSSSQGLSRFPPKQSSYLSQKWSFLCLPLMSSFMRVPRLFRKAIDLIAGSITSDDHPEELLDSAIPDGYPSSLMFYFFYQAGDSSTPDFTFLRPFLAILGFQILSSPSILTLPNNENKLQAYKIKKYQIPSETPSSVRRVGGQFYSNLLQRIQQFLSWFNKQKASVMLKISMILLVTATAVLGQEPQFIDFTYTQLLEQTSYTVGPKDKIIIRPETRHLEKYQFPEVCELEDQLREGADSSGIVDHIINKDDYVEKVRDKILELLKMAEEIKNSRSYLLQISKHMQLREEAPIQDKFKDQLQSLAKKESTLSNAKQKIQALTVELNNKINQYNSNPMNQQFKAVSLNYDIENYNQKINYLRDLKKRSIAKANSQPHTNFTDFFNNLGLDLMRESQQIEFIDKFFQNVSHINYLRDTAHSLKDNIQVDRLNIDYKRSCEKQKQEIISKSSSHAEIKATLNHLREKKKEFGNTPNKYCEGVALKLEMQIKRLLKAINWTFLCADGLNDLIEKRRGDMEKLAEIQRRIAAYGEDGFDQYQRQYENIKDHIQNKFEQIKNFNIDQYSHDPAEIDKLIAQAEIAKADAQEKLGNLPAQINSDETFDQIKKLADLIKTEKVRFCRQFADYDSQQRRLWLLVYAQEQSRTYSSKMRGEFISESRKLQGLEKKYRELSEAVVGELSDNHESS